MPKPIRQIALNLTLFFIFLFAAGPAAEAQNRLRDLQEAIETALEFLTAFIDAERISKYSAVHVEPTATHGLGVGVEIHFEEAGTLRTIRFFCERTYTVMNCH